MEAAIAQSVEVGFLVEETDLYLSTAPKPTVGPVALCLKHYTTACPISLYLGPFIYCKSKTREETRRECIEKGSGNNKEMKEKDEGRNEYNEASQREEKR